MQREEEAAWKEQQKKAPSKKTPSKGRMLSIVVVVCHYDERLASVFVDVDRQLRPRRKRK